MTKIVRKSRIIPFGYAEVPDKKLLTPIKNQLDCLNTAKNLYTDKKISLRGASILITNTTGRYLSYVGFSKIINKNKLKNRVNTIYLSAFSKNIDHTFLRNKSKNKWKKKFGLNAKRIGDVTEYLVTTKLLQSGWEVFKNVSSVGAVDICILNIEMDCFYYIDIKSIPDSYKTPTKFLKNRIKSTGLTTKQNKLNVKLAYYIDDRVYIVLNKENRILII